MRFLRPIFAFSIAFGMYMFGCPTQPIPGVFGNILNLRMEVSAASGLPTAVLWDYDFTQALNKACSATLTTNCVSGFTLSITDAKNNVVGAAQSVPLPATISSTGPTLGVTGAYNGPTALGTYNVLVQVNFKDSSGLVQGGPVASSPLFLTPSAVQNIREQ